MDLTTIKGPSFLKELTEKELNDLAKDIRQFIIESVSQTGGHLSSNLGIVELTIALHYVFNSPEDKIFFDVCFIPYKEKLPSVGICSPHTRRISVVLPAPFFPTKP